MTEQENLGSLTSPEIQHCPFPFLKTLREEAPIYKDPATGMYVITRYEDIGYVNGHPELFSSRTAVQFAKTDSAAAEEAKRRFSERGWPQILTLVAEDPPTHTMQRALVDKVFTISYVRSLEPYIERNVDELIDSFIEQGEIDLIPAFCVKLPLYVIADQLGVDRADIAEFKIWSDATLAITDPTLAPERELELVDQLIDMQNYLYKRVETYRTHPKDNLLSKLVHAEVDGQRLGDAELLSIVQQLLVAGNETTATMLATTTYLMLKDPELKARLMADNGLIPGFVEEALRFHTPVPHMFRVAKEDVCIGDFNIPKGAVLQISYMSGNRDATQWEDPEAFRIGRKGARNHLAFGRGIHFCVGNLLARGELRIAIRRLLERLENLRFAPSAPAPQFMAHFQIHALDRLQVTFDPGERLGAAPIKAA
ncbi:cytochrome P450 [Parasphingorhabdus sp.]|uniref:cytochrome P450 n=1 Tax=Parasphingorhabdus sp. TaxID=2709688 RepID=UPI003A900762